MKAAIWPLLAFAGMLTALFAITLPHWMRSYRERSNREPTQGLGELAYPVDRPGGMNPRGFGSGTGPVLNPNTKAAPVQKRNTQ